MIWKMDLQHKYHRYFRRSGIAVFGTRIWRLINCEGPTMCSNKWKTREHLEVVYVLMRVWVCMFICACERSVISNNVRVEWERME